MQRPRSFLPAVAASAAWLAGPPAGALPPPSIESVAVLAERPLPVPEGAAGDFRIGGISDLALAGSGADGALWGITDRGPNGSVTEPAREGAAARVRRTLPLPGFTPLLVRFAPTAPGDAKPLDVAEAIALSTTAGRPASGRPTLADPRAKPIVDPVSLEPVAIDPDGFDTEGLAALADGRFWIAEEYVPSLAEVGADGRLRRRIVPAGVVLEGASCPVEDSLPADFVQRRENRGFEALAVAPDGTRLYAFLQSPLADPPPAADAPAEPSIGVPLVVVDPVSGRTLAEHLYPLGDPDSDACRWCIAAADGKVSAIAAAGPRALLVLEQSDTESRLYRVEIPERPAPGRTPLDKTLVADLAPLAAAFQADVVPGSTTAPARLSELKFEGMTLLGPDRVALVNDNDFDIAADGGGPAVPAARRTCLWILRLTAPLP